MKNSISFLLVFVLVNQAPFPAFAQSPYDPRGSTTVNVEPRQLDACFNQLFDKFKTSFVKVIKQPVEVNDDMRLQFLTSMVVPLGAKHDSDIKFKAMLVLAAIGYVFFENKIKMAFKKLRPTVNNFDEAVDWEARAEIIAKRIDKKKLDLESTNPVENEQKFKQLKNDIAMEQKILEKGALSFENFEKNSASARLWSKAWNDGYILVQGGLLAFLLLVEFLPGISEANNVNNDYVNVPATVQSLRDSTSVLQFENQMQSNHPTVIALRNDMYAGCRDVLKVNMDLYVESMRQLTADQMLLALKGVR